MAAEFASAALEYAIVFGGTGDVVLPAAVLGVRTDENLYVTEQGGWQAKYIPAFVRRYPFVFFTRDEGKTFTLCIDEAFPGFNQSGRGERLLATTASRRPTWRTCSNSCSNTNSNSTAPRDFARSSRI